MQHLKEELEWIQLDGKIQNLPVEVKDRILHFLGSHYRAYLGYKLDPWETFLDDGLFVILKTILDNGADLKSLLFMKDQYFAEADLDVQTLILLLAIDTQSPAVVKRVCCLWPEVRSLNKGWFESDRIQFLWGVKNLGSSATRSWGSWAYITQSKDYSVFPKLMNAQKPLKSLFKDTDVPQASVADWVLEFPEEYYNSWKSEYSFINDDFKKFMDTIRFYKGERQLYLEWFSKYIRRPTSVPYGIYCNEYHFVAGGETMYKLINEFAGKNDQFLDECIVIYNTAASLGELPADNRNIEYMVSNVVVHDKKELHPILLKIDGARPVLKQALIILNAVKSRDVAALRQLFPSTDEEVYDVGPAFSAKAFKYYDLYFFIMSLSGFVCELEEHFAERYYGERAFIVPVTLNPDILIERILQDVSIEDETYTRSIYGLKYLNYDINSQISHELAIYNWNEDPIDADWEDYLRVVSRKWRTFLSSGHKHQTKIPLKALYHHYRTDPAFRLSDTDHLIQWNYWESDSVLKWFLHRISKENLSLTDKEQDEGDSDSGLIQIDRTALKITVGLGMKLGVCKSQISGKVIARWQHYPDGVNLMNTWKGYYRGWSILNAWNDLIGKNVPDMVF